MDEDKNTSFKKLRKVFSDISKGYSTCIYNGERCYIKHLSPHDQVNLDYIYDINYNIAKKKNIPTYKERLDFLINEELSWSEADEAWLKKQKNFLESLHQRKTHLFIQREIDNQNKRISETSKLINDKLRLKEDLIGMTCESYALKSINEHYITESFFYDDKFEKKIFEEDEFEYLDAIDLSNLVRIYNNEMEFLGDNYIKLLAIQDFFQSYWRAANDNPYYFFGRFISNLSHNQLRLSEYGRIFKNIFEKGINFPEDVRKDPDKIIDYMNSSESLRKKLDKAKDKGASSIVGASNEDLKKHGIKMKNPLSEALKKSGKTSLNTHEIMRIIG